jgi:hypothetical protein
MAVVPYEPFSLESLETAIRKADESRLARQKGCRINGPKPLYATPEGRSAVKWILLLRAGGLGTWRIAYHLNLERIPTKRTGAKWHASTVNKIIHEIYAESEWIESTIERLRFVDDAISAFDSGRIPPQNHTVQYREIAGADWIRLLSLSGSARTSARWRSERLRRSAPRPAESGIGTG